VRALLQSAPPTAPLEVLAFGALGGSVTHEFAAFNTLMRHSNHPTLRLSLASDHTFATVVPRGVSQLHVSSPLRKSPFCGIIPLGAPAHDVTTTGFRWNLSEPATGFVFLRDFSSARRRRTGKSTLSFDSMVSTSNEVVDETVTIATPVPLLFTIDTRQR
jgi:thiamine pyrophosphokinase